MLRAKGEQHDLAFAIARLGKCGFAVEKLFAEHPAGEQSIFIGVFGDGSDAFVVGDIVRRAARKICRRYIL